MFSVDCYNNKQCIAQIQRKTSGNGGLQWGNGLKLDNNIFHVIIFVVSLILVDKTFTKTKQEDYYYHYMNPHCICLISGSLHLAELYHLASLASICSRTIIISSSFPTFPVSVNLRSGNTMIWHKNSGVQHQGFKTHVELGWPAAAALTKFPFASRLDKANFHLLRNNLKKAETSIITVHHYFLRQIFLSWPGIHVFRLLSCLKDNTINWLIDS